MRLCVLIFAIALAIAQTPSSAVKSVIGEVTSIDAASKQIKLKGDDGTAYTVTTGRQHVLPANPPRRKRPEKGHQS